MDTKPPETGIITILDMRANLNGFVEASIAESRFLGKFRWKLIDFRPNKITKLNINLHRFEAVNREFLIGDENQDPPLPRFNIQ